MMGRQTCDQSQLFYLFNLEERIPTGHLLRRINPVVTQVLAVLREKLEPFYSESGRPSIDPDLMIRMLIVGYCYGIRFERKLCEEIELHLAYRWFCRLDLDDRVDVLGQSRRPFPAKRPLPSCIRGGGSSLHECWLGQGPGLCRRCQCYGSSRMAGSAFATMATLVCDMFTHLCAQRLKDEKARATFDGQSGKSGLAHSRSLGKYRLSLSASGRDDCNLSNLHLTLHNRNRRQQDLDAILRYIVECWDRVAIGHFGDLQVLRSQEAVEDKIL
jgi:hypothetical protein